MSIANFKLCQKDMLLPLHLYSIYTKVKYMFTSEEKKLTLAHTAIS